MNKLLILSILTLLISHPVRAQYTAWTGSGVINIITTPEGADLAASASEDNFPLLVRLDSGFFDFSQAKAGGADIRFSSGTTPLKYQIEEWDAASGRASIWVLIPNIKGNAVQPINIHWGNHSAASESNGADLFNASNGYLSVLHMSDAANPAKDDVGVLTPSNHSTTESEGVIGKSRRFAEGRYIDCGHNITSFPSGSTPHSTSAWFKTDRVSGNVLGWGMFEVTGMLVMMLQSPAHIKMEGYFSNGQVEGDLGFDVGQWVHVMHTYESGSARLYVNGVLDNFTTGGTPMNMPTPLNFQIGGFSQYRGYKFAGDIDEVRISSVTRSADWVKLEYENQKPIQNLTGWVVPAGSDFSVSQKVVSVPEDGRVKLTAAAGGALKTVWTLIDGGTETVLATNTLAVDLPGHRVTADKQLVLRFGGVYPTEVKTIDIAVTITDALPDPVFTLTAPATWNGRDPIDVTAQVTNLAEMRAARVGTPAYNWTVSNVAVIKEITAGKLTLKRSQGSGDMAVTLSMDNGGPSTLKTVSIKVAEPARDAWVLRTPGADEKPEDGQFYARSTGGKGTIHYNGTQNGASHVYLKALDGNTEVAKTTEATVEGVYRLSVEVDAKLTHYSVEFGTVDADRGETPVATTNNLLCGDAYIVQGQSNAEATAFGDDDNPTTNPWIKTWGSMGMTTGSGFHTAAHRGTGQVGYWALELARRIVTNYEIPVFIINGAKGGTRVDEHQRNDADPTDATTIYGRLLTRIQGAKLTHGIRGVLWHQGEQDQGSEAPTGLMDWVTYQAYFNDMSADWKSDFPNIAQYYIFQ
ncbi:MAG: DUF2341 domain-containing protein, partial [Planctomycetes bacterium]|nr:DUF2341 domain-containing protein [Planctomycetota bacterium]